MKVARLLFASLLLAGAVALLLHTLLDPEGWTRREKVRADLDAVREENARLEARVEELRAQIRALRQRPEVQERTVRDELGFVRTDDVIVEVSPNSREQ